MNTPVDSLNREKYAPWTSCPSGTPPAKEASLAQHTAVQLEQARLPEEARRRRIQEVQEIAARMGILLEAD